MGGRGKGWVLFKFGGEGITVSAVPLLSTGGDNFQSEILKRGISEKNECLGRIKEFLPWIFTWEAYYVSCLKRPLKIKYGLEGSISNVDLGLF